MGDDLADDLYEMNDLSLAILGEPMGVALASANPACEQNGRLIQVPGVGWSGEPEIEPTGAERDSFASVSTGPYSGLNWR
jgi:hypothetical protein